MRRRCVSWLTRTTPSCPWCALWTWTWRMWWRTCHLPGPTPFMTVWSCFCWAQAHFQVRYCQFTLIWRTDCLRLDYPFSGSNAAVIDTWPDFLYLKWKRQRIVHLIKLNKYSIIAIIFYVKANIYKPDLFLYYSSNLVCMLQGVSKFYINLVIRHPLACSQFLCLKIYSMFEINCQKLFATCVFSIGPGVFGQNEDDF